MLMAQYVLMYRMTAIADSSLLIKHAVNNEFCFAVLVQVCPEVHSISFYFILFLTPSVTRVVCGTVMCWKLKYYYLLNLLSCAYVCCCQHWTS